MTLIYFVNSKIANSQKKNKFASAANALMRISVKQKYFQFLLERVQRERKSHDRLFHTIGPRTEKLRLP